MLGKLVSTKNSTKNYIKGLNFNKNNWNEVQTLWVFANFRCGTFFSKTRFKNGIQSVICLGTPSNRLIDFFSLWSLQQWVTSLVGLVLLYWLAIALYNKRLNSHSIPMSDKFIAAMILSDLLLNLAVGLYYLDYRDTVMGMLMVKCPIAISPVIFVVELLLVILIKEYEIYKSNKSNYNKN